MKAWGDLEQNLPPTRFHVARDRKKLADIIAHEEAMESIGMRPRTPGFSSGPWLTFQFAWGTASEHTITPGCWITFARAGRLDEPGYERRDPDAVVIWPVGAVQFC
jgi:hypothetical protein